MVVPSMPGFAFSGQPRRPGYGPKEMGEAVNNLMLKLGYNRYVAQGAFHTPLLSLCISQPLKCKLEVATGSKIFF